MNYFGRRTLILLAIVVLAVLLSGGTLHALVEHDHDEAMWDGAHAALIHEQKYLFGILFPMLLMLGAFAAGSGQNGVGRVRPDTGRLRLHQLDLLLSGGVLSYRAFG